MNEKNQNQKKTQILEEAYLESLPNKLADIEKKWQEISLNFDKRYFEYFYKAVHTLHGSSVTYGYTKLSQAIRDLDVYLKQLVNYNELNANRKSEITHLIERIKDVVPTKKAARVDVNQFGIAQKKFQQLQEHYFKNLPDKVLDICTKWHEISRLFNKQAFDDFINAVHSLHGSTATYGYTKLSKSLRDLEVYLRQLTEAIFINATQQSEISHLVERIKETLYTKGEFLQGALESFSYVITSKLIIYLIHKEDPLKLELQASLKEFGYRLIFLTAIDQFQEHINKDLPSAVIVDEYYLSDKKINLIARYRQQYQIPVLCIASHDDLATRLKAVRAGVTIFLRHPVNVFFITKQIDKLCGLSVKENYRILVLDDSLSLVEYYALILTEAGMTVRTLTNPMNLLHELQEFNPNLLLMDLYMPGCSGFELATIVRQEEYYMSLPIIFASTEDDRFKQLAILNSCGGDDFLTKPLLPQNLVAAVKSRAQRSALLVSFIIHDNLTHLLNHTYILKQLEHEILRAQRYKETMIVAMLDLDNFKKVNDTYGHPVGDSVLKEVAELLIGRVRQTDFVGRYGGEEFLIIFPRTSVDKSCFIFNDLCTKISSYAFRANDKEFHVTISIGVAEYPGFQTTESLVEAADRALYQAKSKGRNRVEFITHDKFVKDY